MAREAVERAVLVHRALEGQAVLVAREAQRAQAAAAARDPAGAWAVVAPPSPYQDRLSEGRQPSRMALEPPGPSPSLKGNHLREGCLEALIVGLSMAISQYHPLFSSFVKFDHEHLSQRSAVGITGAVTQGCVVLAPLVAASPSYIGL